MTVQEWIEEYRDALESDGAESNRAVAAAESLRGCSISAVVDWPNGRKTTTSGTVIVIRDDTVYFESGFGNVAGSVATMEANGD